ncbi:MAG: serine/threonine protein phosphatase [Spirochaetes bacterium]|nr:serine/threonine protein phosphatase [Spirochaetota bacterium]
MSRKFYLVGDIHGQLSKLKKLISDIKSDIEPDDLIIFLGDYIDRGPESFEVIEFLLKLKSENNIICLIGNHEDMFLRFVSTGDNYNNYMANGGKHTIRSYSRNLKGFNIPESHKKFYNSLKLYYEDDLFIAVHAGISPKVRNITDQERVDLIWIREDFYRYNKRWDKTVIFGHTPTTYISNSKNVYIDNERNIIGIDTNAMSEGFPLSCIRLPDRKIYKAY